MIEFLVLGGLMITIFGVMAPASYILWRHAIAEWRNENEHDK